MFEERKYSPGLGYRNYSNIFYSPTFYPNSEDIKKDNEAKNDINTEKNENKKDVENKTQNYSKNVFEPITFGKDRISAFGFNFNLDDLIILGLLIFLLFQDSIDYVLIIVLGLMLLDINFSTIFDNKIFKNLSFLG